MIKKTIEIAGTNVGVEFEALNGAVKILSIEVAGFKESASEIGSELKKTVADALVRAFPEFFIIGGNPYSCRTNKGSQQ